MYRYISVNCKMIPVINKFEDNQDKYCGIRSGSVLLISNDCIIPRHIKEFLDQRGIIIFRLPQDSD